MSADIHFTQLQVVTHSVSAGCKVPQALAADETQLVMAHAQMVDHHALHTTDRRTVPLAGRGIWRNGSTLVQ